MNTTSKKHKLNKTQISVVPKTFSENIGPVVDPITREGSF